MIQIKNKISPTVQNSNNNINYEINFHIIIIIIITIIIRMRLFVGIFYYFSLLIRTPYNILIYKFWRQDIKSERFTF